MGESILLDTNMLIYLEDDKEIEINVAKLTRIIYDSDIYRIVIHPNTLIEANKIRDERRKKIFKSKLGLYKEIDNPPKATEEFHKLIGCSSTNDIIDNDLLFAVKQNCVSYFITNDAKLRKKAERIGLKNRVLGIEEAIKKLEIKEKENISTPIFIRDEFLYQIEVEDKFFDTLREDYKGFDKWFIEKQKEKNKAYVSRNDKKEIKSFLMLKVENESESYEEFEKPFSPAKRLKISTLKVDDRGKRIGETFLKIIMQKAVQEEVDEVYITVFKKHTRLIELLKEYGFKYYTYKNTENKAGQIEREYVFVRCMKDKEYYPFIKYENQKIFLIPIQPTYHKLLFPEAIINQQITFNDYEGANSASNAIGKAFISNANINKIQKNDILLFYASHDIKAITSIGIVDETFSSFENLEDVANLVRKRTAYTDEQLKDNVKSDSLVIMFKHYISLTKPITLKCLIENKIVSGPIQCPQEVKKVENFIKVLKKSKEDLKYFEFN